MFIKVESTWLVSVARLIAANSPTGVPPKVAASKTTGPLRPFRSVMPVLARTSTAARPGATDAAR